LEQKRRGGNSSALTPVALFDFGVGVVYITCAALAEQSSMGLHEGNKRIALLQ
jgi:hypothetical protein